MVGSYPEGSVPHNKRSLKFSPDLRSSEKPRCDVPFVIGMILQVLSPFHGDREDVIFRTGEIILITDVEDFSGTCYFKTISVLRQDGTPASLGTRYFEFPLNDPHIRVIHVQF